MWGRPLWKGESFDQFDPNGAEASVCPASEEALRKARKSRPGAESLLADQMPVATGELQSHGPSLGHGLRFTCQPTDGLADGDGMS